MRGHYLIQCGEECAAHQPAEYDGNVVFREDMFFVVLPVLAGLPPFLRINSTRSRSGVTVKVFGVHSGGGHESTYGERGLGRSYGRVLEELQRRRKREQLEDGEPGRRNQERLRGDI